MSEQDDKMMGMLCHLLAIFTWFIGPLIIWLVKREESQFVDANGKNALNFTITISIGYIALWIVGLVLAIVFAPLGFIFFGLAWIVGVIALVFYIMGTVKSYAGEVYEYPFSLNLIK